jgi:RNA-binding protein 5/10
MVSAMSQISGRLINHLDAMLAVPLRSIISCETLICFSLYIAFSHYHIVHTNSICRPGRSYNGRRSVDGCFPRDSYGSGAFSHNVHDRDMYPPPPPVGSMWSQPQRNHDEEYATTRDHRRHDNDYRGANRFHYNYHAADHYHESGSHRDFGANRHKRIGSRDRPEFHGEFEDRYRGGSHQNREDSYERDHEYERYSYDSDYETSRSWRRRDSCESERDRRGLSRERGDGSCMRHSRSRSRGRDDRSRSRSRSRSPRAKSRSRNQRDDCYDDNRFDRRREYDWDERRRGDSVVLLYFIFS